MVTEGHQLQSTVARCAMCDFDTGRCCLHSAARCCPFAAGCCYVAVLNRLDAAVAVAAAVVLFFSPVAAVAILYQDASSGG